MPGGHFIPATASAPAHIFLAVAEEYLNETYEKAGIRRMVLSFREGP
jgi:hypothetical protein